jgi:hypothetical protein
VTREKTTALNNARNTFETELRKKTSELETNLRKAQVCTGGQRSFCYSFNLS